MASRLPPDWDDDSPALGRNLAKLVASLERDAARRALPTLDTAKKWHRQMIAGLAVQDVQMVWPVSRRGRARGLLGPGG